LRGLENGGTVGGVATVSELLLTVRGCRYPIGTAGIRPERPPPKTFAPRYHGQAGAGVAPLDVVEKFAGVKIESANN